MGLEIAEDGLRAGEVIDGIEAAIVIEDYPTYPKGPCVLVLQRENGEADSRSLGHPVGADIAGGVGDRLSGRSGAPDRGFPAEAAMNARRPTRFVREGSSAAGGGVDTLRQGHGRSAHRSLHGAPPLD